MLFATCVIGVVVIVCSELSRRKGVINNETARKVIHVAHALLIGVWVFKANYWLVVGAEIVSLGIVYLDRIFGIFAGLRRVERVSYGEFFFPFAVIVMALLHVPEWIFLAAILHFGLADAAASLVGQKAKRGRYKVWGQYKSVQGSVAFWLTSIAIIYWLIMLSPAGFSSATLLPAIIIIPLCVLFAENISPYGSDNFAVPIVAATALLLFK